MQLASREYKLILKANNFTDKEKGRKEIIDMLKNHFEKNKGKFTAIDKKAEKKKVGYLDTQTHDLNKRYNFLLWIREEYDEGGKIKGYDITFKNRNSNKTEAASFDLSGFQENSNFKFEEHKFEEDIITPFESKFSISTKFKSKEYPKLDTYKNITDIFPNLNLDILENERLLKVNRVKVNEFSYDLGNIEYHDAMDGGMQLGIWYDSSKLPIIAEFDIDVKAKDLTNSDEIQSNEFPPSKIHEINEFYMVLQGEKSIVDLDTSKTKTQYVYDFGR